jgi:hypothetical protein
VGLSTERHDRAKVVDDNSPPQEVDMASTVAPRSAIRRTDAESLLRRVLLADGVATTIVGGVLLVAPATVTGFLDNPSASLVRVLGAILVVLGVDVAWASRARTAWLPVLGFMGAGVAAVGALALVAGILGSAFTGAGTVVAVVVIAMLLGLAETEALLARRLRQQRSA